MDAGQRYIALSMNDVCSCLYLRCLEGWNIRYKSADNQISSNNRDGVNESLREARRSEAVCAAILVLVCVVSPIIIALVTNAVNTIQVFFKIWDNDFLYMINFNVNKQDKVRTPGSNA